MRNQFGFGASMKEVEQARKFVQAMLDQGFEVKGTYEPRESVDRAATAKLEGFTVMLIARDGNSICAETNEVSAHAWGTDGLAIDVDLGKTENILEQLKTGMKICNACGKETEKSHRYSFAGRMCSDCRATHKEPEGWSR